MNTKQAILKCNKKAWKEIKRIQNASNMLCVQEAITNAVSKTFGLWDKGLLKIQMRESGNISGWEGLMNIRNANRDKHLFVVRQYLIEQVPARFFKTTMYQQLIGNI